MSNWFDTPSYVEEITERDLRPVTLPQSPDPKRFEHTLPGLGGDRRRLGRRKFVAEVAVDPYDEDLPGCATITEDISDRGMFIAAAHQYPLGTLLWLTIDTEHGELELTGRVVHLIQGVGFGCEFIDLSDRQRNALTFLVSTARQPATGLPRLQ
jgi:hypothetical protein